MLGTTNPFADTARMTRRFARIALVACGIAAFLPGAAQAACTAREAAEEASQYGQVVAVYRVNGGFLVRIRDSSGYEQEIFVPASC